MAIEYVRDVIASGYNLSKINDNFAKIEQALQDAVSRSGEGPNAMASDLDLNSNDLLNAGIVDTAELRIGGAVVTPDALATIPPSIMTKQVYDPQGIEDDAFDRANHTGTQEAETTVLNARIIANSRETATTMNLSNVETICINRYSNLSAYAPIIYKKVDPNVEPSSRLKFQDVGGRWFEGIGEQYTPDMFDIPTDGTTLVYTELQAMLDAAAGKVISMPRATTFEIGSNALSVKEGTTIYWNGCTIRRSTVLNNYSIEIDGINVTFKGKLIHTTAGERGLRVRYSDFNFDYIELIADTPGTGFGNILKDAFRVDTNGTSYPSRIKGRVYIENFEMGLCTKGCDEIDVRVDVVNYRTAVWWKNTTNGRLTGSARVGSPNNTGTPGENGFLCESDGGHFLTSDLDIYDWKVEDSGEHANRVGGQGSIRHVNFVNCRTKNTGLGLGTGVEPDDHGGCGFKALGPTSILGAYHYDINFINCVVEDVVYSTDTDQNFAGFDIGKVIGCSIVNPRVQRSDPSVTSAFSCLNGIEVYGSQYVHITNPLIDKPFLSGIYFFENASTGSTFWGQQNWYHTVVGGRVFSPGKAGVHVKPVNLTFRRISIQGLEVEAGERGLHYEVAGTGGQTQCSADMMCINQTVESMTGTATWYIEASGTFVGAPVAANGSTYRDFTTGTLRYRKAGAWTSL